MIRVPLEQRKHQISENHRIKNQLIDLVGDMKASASPFIPKPQIISFAERVKKLDAQPNKKFTKYISSIKRCLQIAKNDENQADVITRLNEIESKLKKL